MPGARKEYRVILSELDSKVIMISIVRVCEKNYNFIVNGEIVKNYKKREVLLDLESCTEFSL